MPPSILQDLLQSLRHHKNFLFPLKHTYQIKAWLQSFISWLPFGRAYLIAMLCHKLTCLKATEKFICVTPNITCCYLINYDFSFRIYNKTSSFSHSAAFNQYFKIFTQRMGWIRKHWVSVYMLGAYLSLMLYSATGMNAFLAFFISIILTGGVGYLLAVLLVTEAQHRLRSKAIPSAFRGLPITLVYIGVLALAIYGFTGHSVIL